MTNLLKVSTAVASSLLVTTITLSGCITTNTSIEENKVIQQSIHQVNTKFQAFSKQFIEGYWKLNPGYAVYMGYYKYDTQLIIPNAKTAEQEMAFFNQQLSLLQEFDPASLNANQSSDYYILKNQIESPIWNNNELKSSEWDPSNYNVAYPFGIIFSNG